jgi:hypothetical protein
MSSNCTLRRTTTTSCTNDKFASDCASESWPLMRSLDENWIVKWSCLIKVVQESNEDQSMFCMSEEY